MNIRLHWQTAYSYESPVRMVHTELRVLPSTRFGQEVTWRSLEAEPEAPVGLLMDAFGNDVHRIGFLESVDRIRLSAEASVSTPQPGGWVDELSPLHRHLALQETKRCPFDASIVAFADEAGPSNDAWVYALKLMERISDRFTFEIGATDVGHTALDLFELGAGVCQDFTHLMIAALRVRGIPAFYASGYLAPSEGVEEGTASHAWVHAYLDGAWHGFDPANRQRQDERYAIVAVGRDYDDVPPVRGSVRGVSEEEFATVLRVHGEQAQ